MKKQIVVFCIFAIVAATGMVFAQDEKEKEFSLKTIQIGMVVHDLDTSLKFYKDILGFKQVGRTSFDIGEDFARRSGLSMGVPFHVEVLKLGSGENATELKLMSFGDKVPSYENEYIFSQTGVQYLTIFVKDLDPFIESLQENDVPFLGETPTHLPGADEEEKKFLLIKDPDGTFLELIERQFGGAAETGEAVEEAAEEGTEETTMEEKAQDALEEGLSEEAEKEEANTVEEATEEASTGEASDQPQEEQD